MRLVIAPEIDSTPLKYHLNKHILKGAEHRNIYRKTKPGILMQGAEHRNKILALNLQQSQPQSS
jgi:hypothetical protein